MVTVSIIGCGVWGRNHIRVFSELPNTKIKSVVDIDKNSVSTLAQKYHVQN